MSVTILRANALTLPLADASVDLVVTSPPYFGLRSYQDGGEHYSGQLGSEATPAEFVDALIVATREMVRVLKPSGSIWVNLGDSYYSGKGAPGRTTTDTKNAGRNPRREGGSHLDASGLGIPRKSLVGIPWRYAIRCIDELGLILRAEVIWSKPNGLPESVTDRVRRSHEQWFHFTKEPHYYSAVDEIREEHLTTGRGLTWEQRKAAGIRTDLEQSNARSSEPVGIDNARAAHPLGKLPGSVWTVPTEPLRVPESLGIDHFAAFPTEWPRRIIQGWSPREVCTACGEGRRPVIASVGLDMSRPQARRANELAEKAGLTEDHLAALLSVGVSDTGRGKATQNGTGKNRPEVYALADVARDALGGYAREYLLRRPTGLSYACACPDTSAPATPGVVLDPFGGTGTVALVADVLGRDGITVDLSADYCRLAEWRTSDPKQRAKAARVERAPEVPDGQLSLFGEPA